MQGSVKLPAALVDSVDGFLHTILGQKLMFRAQDAPRIAEQ